MTNLLQTIALMLLAVLLYMEDEDVRKLKQKVKTLEKKLTDKEVNNGSNND